MNYILEPWEHQKTVIEYVEANDVDYYALFHDMGAGKTKTSIELLRLKCSQRKRYIKTLIICPLVVMENWQREILTHSKIPESKIQILDGCRKPNSNKKLKNPNKKTRMLQLDNSKASVFIINTDNVSNQDVWDKILELGIEFLIVDESHRFKAHNGKRTKNLHKLALQDQCRYKFILTGSPILQNALDLWSQFYILDPNILGSNFFSFRSKYFFDANAGMPSHVHFPNWQPIKELDSNLSSVIYQHAHRVMKDDVLDLPPRTYQTMEVPFTKEQRKIYEDMRDHLVAFLEGDPVQLEGGDFNNMDLDLLPDMMTADLAIVKTLRLQQLVCGIFTNSEGELSTIKNNRIKVLEELLTELSTNKLNKMIVWTVFTPTYKEISEVCTKLGIKFVLLTGQQSKDEKVANVDAFNNDPEVTLIIANQGAGGTGVNLTAANYDIYYSRSFNLEHDLQSDSRSYRGGQKRKTTRLDLITPDTIDAKVVEALASKRKGAEDILAVKEREFTSSELFGFL